MVLVRVRPCVNDEPSVFVLAGTLSFIPCSWRQEKAFSKIETGGFRQTCLFGAQCKFLPMLWSCRLNFEHCSCQLVFYVGMKQRPSNFPV